MIWFKEAPLDAINEFCKNTLLTHLGIEFTEIGDDYISATMPVNPTTHQPLGLLHGGASVALAESVGSMASALCVDQSKFSVVGTDIAAKHIRGKKEGLVTGTATLIHKGNKTHIWNIDIVDEAGKLICAVRMTNMVLPHS